MKGKFLQFLGIANRAGALISGTLLCEKALKKKQGKLLLLATDVAPEVAEKMRYLAHVADIPIIKAYPKAALGEAIGKSQRAAIIVTDDGLANRLVELSR